MRLDSMGGELALGCLGVKYGSVQSRERAVWSLCHFFSKRSDLVSKKANPGLFIFTDLWQLLLSYSDTWGWLAIHQLMLSSPLRSKARGQADKKMPPV